MRPPNEKADARAGASAPRHHKKQSRCQSNPSATKPFAVLAVKANGVRVVAGHFRTRADADHSAALLRPLARLTGGDAIVVEQERGGR